MSESAEERKPEEAKPEEAKPEEAKHEEAKPEEKPGDKHEGKGKAKKSNLDSASISSFKTKGRLFTLDIVLDKLQLSYYTEFMNRCKRGTNMISFKFLREGPITICENKAVTAEAAGKRTGTSAMFALTFDELHAIRNEFCLQIEVYRNTCEEDVHFGKACISLVNLFKCVSALADANEYKKFVIEEEQEYEPPPCPARCITEMVKEHTHLSIPIIAPEGVPCKEAAVLSLIIRLSCFGSFDESDDPCKDPPCKDDNLKYICCCRAPKPAQEKKEKKIVNCKD